MIFNFVWLAFFLSANLLGLKADAGVAVAQPRPPDTATNAQIMLLVLNTAGLTLIPTSVIAIRQTKAVMQGLVGFNAATIFLRTLVATGCGQLSALACAFFPGHGTWVM
ncbi:MAG: hypothetical protein Q4G70_12935 [Pseudomonadota bacterium]|nr:hypothetical protein [Pseudomonadota bacterium]